MNWGKKIARTTIFPFGYSLKLDNLWRLFSRNSILNVMFHGVVTEDMSKFSSRHITAIQFEKYLKYFSKNFEVISLIDAFNIYKKGLKPKSKTITISFDDGYLNNLTVALPLLEKYKMHATFLISGMCVDNQKGDQLIWADKISAIGKIGKIQINDLLFENYVNPKNKINIFDFIKFKKKDERDNIILEVENKFNLKERIYNIPKEAWALLGPDEILSLASSKYVQRGSHGNSHYNLSNIDIDDAITDLKVSKNKLESLLNNDIEMLAYPDGSYNEGIKKEAYNMGYKKQLCVNYLFPNDLSDKNILNRFGISTTTTFESNIFSINKAFYYRGYN